MKYFVHCVSKTTGKIRYVVSWGLLILPGWFCLFDLCCAWPSVGLLWYWSVPWRVVGENLLSRVWVCRFAISVHSWCPPLLPRFYDSWAQRTVEGLGKGGKARMPAAVRGLKANLISSARKKLKRSREQEETKGSWMFHLDGGLYQYKGTDVEGTRRIDDRDRLQTGRGASMGNIDVRRAGRICWAMWSQESVLREKTRRAKIWSVLPDKARRTLQGQARTLEATLAGAKGSPTSSLKNQVK